MKTGWTLLLAIVLLTSRTRAGEDEAHLATLRETSPLTGLGPNVANGFTGWNLVLHFTAVAATPVLIATGADTSIHNTMARHQRLEPCTVPAVYLGYALPVVVAAPLVGLGLIRGSSRELAAGSAVVQATVIAVTYQTVLKAVTGRPAPEPVVYADDSASRTFRFGFLRGGIHFGWPSGHMMTTTAILSSLFPLYPDSWVLKLGAGVLFAYMLGSVAMHERSSMHWGSDMLAGTLMGFAIGQGAGAGFARHVGIDPRQSFRIGFAPMMDSNGTRGISMHGLF